MSVSANMFTYEPEILDGLFEVTGSYVPWKSGKISTKLCKIVHGQSGKAEPSKTAAMADRYIPCVPQKRPLFIFLNNSVKN